MLPLLLASAAILAGCTAPTDQSITAPGGSTPAGGGSYCDQFSSSSRQKINQDGSSTVFPVAEAWAEKFGGCLNLEFAVAFAGTGGGFQRFCRGEIQISDASRPIKGTEQQDCLRNGIDPFEIQVAIDGLAVVVDKDNTFVDHLTVTELNKIWTATASKQANTWKQLRPEWPDRAIELWGPGTNSGTFDYFIEVIIHPFDGSASKGRNDYSPSEDDNILVQGVERSPYALGYFGLAYVQSNAGKVRAVPIKQDTSDGGKTFNSAAQPVEPTAANVEGGKYKPLARPLFMYTDGKPKDRLLEYFRLGLDAQGQNEVDRVGYVRLPESVRTTVLAKLD